ncbi:putative exo-beta-1,3-glucanase [Aspergillus clavatus NRRL 1]|uniref:Probable glucan 1,3-beta-glucosidase D n=1 Tax=Aspergillus clavatus (strain ATCC 1007 / CBS 513.65 / DSM 816 / NCTC 3887 / NRRL 1 / QM 1276 / 107) TaxID=344612 RepID=EXGD_ASPCL|nr:exo-beta-1,3-glucanase, putative [Aspergillus clavatus NRRL 1]A1CTI3.1 RecName: Full=Probable glucan 1,3-beta-glucosidase D; AltName: Full=Exo-1,3-beta-glucanase D [Aspergillus clavatus NRRL 1]EAW06620.1 exo-beta-1,3-glucanase, putative [Aspergillus clavatus NRRL 1]
MPSQSRSRDRYRGRDTEYTRRRYPDEHDYSHDDHDYDYDDDDDDNDDLEQDVTERRYRRDGYRRPRGESRARAYYERDAAAAAAHDEELLAEERERRRAGASGSPRKSGQHRERDRDRERDREAQSRRRTYEDDGRHRTRDGRRERRREGGGEGGRRERRRGESRRGEAARKHQSSDSTNSASHLLSADALARLGSQYEKEDRRERAHAKDAAKAERKRRKKRAVVGEQERGLRAEKPRDRSRARVASGAYMEEGRGPEMEFRRRGGGGPPMDARWPKGGGWGGSVDGGDAGRPFWKQKKWLIGIGVVILILVIVIPVAVVVSKKHNDKPNATTTQPDGTTPSNSNLDGLSPDSIPGYAKGTFLDPWTWYDTNDFNVTFTNETVGGLSLMGLNSTWDDSARPNDNVPPLNKPFPYGKQPIRGVNLGGWLSLEPFITPSFFQSYSALSGVIDEYTLTQKLGSTAGARLEKHYATFITEQDFADIRDAGLDHVRIQYSYWAVTTYDGDPYVAKTSWRYLLRAIEYCRKYGLRVKLDPHGIPGSQNGWNHSGRQGAIGWLNGTDGELNRKRSLEVHDQVSKFFAQDRYKNVVTIYGLVNEPLMLSLSVEDVLNWTVEATKLVQKNGITAYIALHDGFLNLSKWKSILKTRPDNMLLDTHQYTIFNTGQIVLNHTARVNLICNDWSAMIKEVNSTSGFGPTICGEWSQADTDCAQYLNNVGRGTRWEGTFSLTDSTQYCPTADSGPRCSCANANADPSAYSADYKKFLQTYAEAQMSAFETGQGWFYWTWRTESAAQWSYRTAWKGGFMPQKAYSPSFKCGDTVPDFGSLPEYY